MNTLFKVTLEHGYETYVIADDLSSAAHAAEQALIKHWNRVSKVTHITVIASESSSNFNQKLTIAPPPFPEGMYDGDTQSEGLYR